MSNDLSTPHAWDERYRTQNTPWDLGSAAPPFIAALEDGLKKGPLTAGTIAIPGCGRGHEAILFARRGFQVSAMDVSERACAAVRQAAHHHNLEVNVIHGDALCPRPQDRSRYDYILEQTFFCAIDPQRRTEYVEAIWQYLKPGGTLFGLYFDIDEEDGPPFGTTPDELERLFGSRFRIDCLERCKSSHDRRAGEELWAEFTKV